MILTKTKLTLFMLCKKIFLRYGKHEKQFVPNILYACEGATWCKFHPELVL
jgi:hypothetical protein